jgi:hypothetical protein
MNPKEHPESCTCFLCAKMLRDALRECRAELAELKTTVVANQQAADREYKRRVQAESERDTARADVQGLADHWQAEIEQHAALQAKVARAVELVSHVIAYLSDRDDIESTPLHAIGHARHQAEKALEALR